MNRHISDTDFQIIISPAKKMNCEPDILPYRDLPFYLKDAQMLVGYLQTLSYPQLKTLWNCSDKIAGVNWERLREMEMTKNLTPAILSYEGIQYKYMAPQVLEENALAYLERHLYILSGLYGILRPFDGVVPYRLEMQAKFQGWEYRNLYEFWGERLAETLCEGCAHVLNLASKEYSRAVDAHLPSGTVMTDVVFGEIVHGKVVEKGTYAKMARGEMVRFLAQNEIRDIERVREFSALGYEYREEYSSARVLTFLKEPKRSEETEVVNTDR